MKKRLKEMYQAKELFGGEYTEIIEYDKFKAEINILEKDEISDREVMGLLIDFLEGIPSKNIDKEYLLKYIDDLYEIKK